MVVKCAPSCSRARQANGSFWHFAAFAALQFFGSYRTNNGHHRTLVRRGSVAIGPKPDAGGVVPTSCLVSNRHALAPRSLQ